MTHISTIIASTIFPFFIIFFNNFYIILVFVDVFILFLLILNTILIWFDEIIDFLMLDKFISGMTLLTNLIRSFHVEN